jgi:hypothetical protein
MKNVWRWIAGILIGLAILGLLGFVRSNKQAYEYAHSFIENRTSLTQARIDAATQAAMTSVDLALKLTAELPSQQAAADLIKQDIQEIHDRLSEAADLRGELAVDKLNLAVDKFNQTLSAVDQAAQEADTPAVKAVFDRIYGVLLSAQEQVTNFLITAGQK